jgi:hypothetical protein
MKGNNLQNVVSYIVNQSDPLTTHIAVDRIGW